MDFLLPSVSIRFLKTSLEPIKVPMCLKTSKSLFDVLNKKRIKYCHWKSNEHLKEALAGETDLDIFVSSQDKEEFYRTLKEFNFKKVISQPMSRYCGMEDWLGFDPETGKLLHIHLHFKLILGSKNVKEYQLPLEEMLLNNCGEIYGVKVPRPEIELFLLFIRTLLKVNYKRFLKSLLKGRYAIPENIKKEYLWLLDKVSLNELENLFPGFNPDIPYFMFERFLRRLNENNLQPVYLLKERRKVKRALKPYLRKKRLEILKRKMNYFLYRLPFTGKILNVQRKKRFCSGLYLAFIGADGSGKTTLSRLVIDWFSWKMDTKAVYFGIPKKGLPRKVAVIIKKSMFFAAKRCKNIGLKGIGLFFEKTGRFFFSIYWVYLARKRLQTHRRALKLKNKGIIIIADRFPLKNFWNMEKPMDGPRIKGNLSPVLKCMAGYEKKVYSYIGFPDKLLILQGDKKVLRKRKNDISNEQLARKTEAVKKLNGLEGALKINCEEKLEEALLVVKRIIWGLV